MKIVISFNIYLYLILGCKVFMSNPVQRHSSLIFQLLDFFLSPVEPCIIQNKNYRGIAYSHGISVPYKFLEHSAM